MACSFAIRLSAILCVSDEIARQVRRANERPHGTHLYVCAHVRPRDLRRHFAPPVAPLPASATPGEFERDKGVFDLLEICQRFVLAGNATSNSTFVATGA